MKSLYAVIAITLFLMACGDTSAPSGDREFVRDIEGFEPVHLSHPEGVDPIPPVPGVYNPEVVASAEAKATSAAALELLNRGAKADDWIDADRAVRDFVDSPDSSAAAAPRYVLEQLALTALMRRDDFRSALRDSETSREEERIVRFYLDLAVQNRYPDPTTAEDLLVAAEPFMDPGEQAEVATASLRAVEHYDRLREGQANAQHPNCEECRAVLRDMNAGGTDARRQEEARWNESRESLRRIASAGR